MTKIILEIEFDDSDCYKGHEDNTSELIKDSLESEMQYSLQADNVIKEGWKVKLIEEDRINKLEAVSDLISRIYHYGNFKIETPNERTLAGLLNDLKLFPTTESEILKRSTYPDYETKYRNYKI